MNKYDYSKPINLWYTSDSAEYHELVTKLRDIIEIELKANHGLTRFNKSEHEIALIHILADLYITYKADPKRYLAFSRDKGWFSLVKERTRYKPKRFALKPFIQVVNALEALEYIEATKGFQDSNTGKSRLSRMIAKVKLAELCDEHKLNLATFYELPNKESIILKSKKDDQGNKNLIDYEDTAATELMRDNLKLINKNISKHWIDLKITDEQFDELQQKLYTKATSDSVKDKYKAPVDFSKVNLFRVFNYGDNDNSQFKQGGRFYGGWWLAIPSEYRSRIRINDKKTVELDYSAIHFYMMYAEQGLMIPDIDPYTLDNIDRKKAKLALNTALNASSKEHALSAIIANQWPDKKREEVVTILDKLLDKHKPIAEYFYTGKGLYLQFNDSQIAELVMLNMWNKHGVIVLPVHDSFIVSAASYDDLYKMMLTSFNQITGYTAKLKATISDESLKSPMDKLAQQVDYDDSGLLTKVGVNAADTWDAYKKEKNGYNNYWLRKNKWNSK